MRVLPAIRGRDIHGAGYFGAQRGARTHVGVDCVAAVGSPVTAFGAGKVAKIGRAYADKPGLRYVEIAAEKGFTCRYFYCDPVVTVGQKVLTSQMLGRVQQLPYPGITPHYHFEVRGADGTVLDPLKYLSDEV